MTKSDSKEMAAPKLSLKELERLLRAEFPEMLHGKGGYAVEAVWQGGCRVRKRFDPQSLRPGGTLSGPTMMTLADFGIYVAILATIGWLPLAATTSLNINFLKMPAPRDLLGEVRLIKVGRRLAVGEMDIRSEGDGKDDLVAHATATYSIPPHGR